MKMNTVKLGAGALLAAAFLMAGCETEPAGEADIVVTPPAATVPFGHSTTFVASGWFGYTWSLEHADWGFLSQHTGDRTTYTSTLNAGTNSAVGTNAFQILHCHGLARDTVRGTATNLQASATTAPQTDVYIKVQ